MKFKLLLCVTFAVLLSGGWLYMLSAGAAAAFQQTYNGFGIVPPEITVYLFSILNYWWAILLCVALASYLPFIILKGKWQYAALLTSFACLLILVSIVYLPILTMGSVV